MSTGNLSVTAAPIHSIDPGEHSSHLKLVEGLPVEEVHRRALQASTALASAYRALCFWLLEVERRELYRHFGCSNVFHYAELYLELAPHTVAEHLRTGKEMERLPLLARACQEGEIAPSKLREISRVVTPETERQWLDIARSSTYRQIENMVPLTPRGGLPPLSRQVSTQAAPSPGTEDSDDDPGGKRSGTFHRQGATSLDIRPETESPHHEAGEERGVGPARYHTKLVAELENEQMAILEQALSKARRETGERGIAALLEHIARTFLYGTSSPATGDSAPRRITLHHVPGSPVAWVEGPGGPRHVPSSTLEEALCDAEILDLRETVDTGARAQDADGHAEERCGSCTAEKRAEDPARDGVSNTPARDRVTRSSTTERGVKDPGRDPVLRDPARHGPRMRRTIPLTLRRKVLERDGRCMTPGCGCMRYLSLHHIDPVRKGGKDSDLNLTVVCYRCHRAIHRGELSVTGEAPAGLVWKNKGGTILKGSSKEKKSACESYGACNAR